jgi:hypothetical protein
MSNLSKNCQIRQLTFADRLAQIIVTLIHISAGLPIYHITLMYPISLPPVQHGTPPPEIVPLIIRLASPYQETSPGRNTASRLDIFPLSIAIVSFPTFPQNLTYLDDSRKLRPIDQPIVLLASTSPSTALSVLFTFQNIRINNGRQKSYCLHNE